MSDSRWCVWTLELNLEKHELGSKQISQAFQAIIRCSDQFIATDRGM